MIQRGEGERVGAFGQVGFPVVGQPAEHLCEIRDRGVTNNLQRVIIPERGTPERVAADERLRAEAGGGATSLVVGHPDQSTPMLRVG